MKRAIVGLTCSVLMILIISQQAFAVGVVIANPTPPTVYVAPDPYWQTGQALGNLLGAMIQRSNEQAAEKRLEKEKQEMQEIMNDVVRKETEGMTTMISQSGLDNLWSILDRLVYEQGHTPYKNISDGISTMSFTQDIGGGAQIFREYSINMNTKQCRSIVRLTSTGQEAVCVMPFTLPEVQQQAENSANFGWLLDIERKSENKGFMVMKILPGGLADLAGIKEGDILTKLDTYSIVDNDTERLGAYIDMRVKHKAILKATVLRNQKSHVIAMQL